jgi:hypothetical protein
MLADGRGSYFCPYIHSISPAVRVMSLQSRRPRWAASRRHCRLRRASCASTAALRAPPRPHAPVATPCRSAGRRQPARLTPSLHILDPVACSLRPHVQRYGSTVSRIFRASLPFKAAARPAERAGRPSRSSSRCLGKDTRLPRGHTTKSQHLLWLRTHFGASVTVASPLMETQASSRPSPICNLHADDPSRHGSAFCRPLCFEHASRKRTQRFLVVPSVQCTYSDATETQNAAPPLGLD